MARFPSMKARRLLAILQRPPLGYSIVRQKGSHRTLRASGRSQITFAFHDSQTLPPGLVRKVLVDEAGLSESDALELL